ncbi:MAG TPA: hypothetical protein VHQ43_03285 [Solirubrobacterales bacterium]|jgi:hypothetical protein|nr:hypothetical protein [Solirubrobacterales bacterium]
MRATIPWLIVLAVLPRVEDPWPDKIGVELPFATAAIGSVLAGVAFSLTTQEKRERAIKLGGLFGFCAGSAFFVVSLLVQLVSDA